MWWSYQLGGNLFGIFFLTYLILWFAIPSAKSARQKLEAEGKPISARTIADRQGATQEEKAKSSVASAVTTLGSFMVIVLKVLLGFMLFPITFAVFGVLFALIVITIGVGDLFITDIGNFAGIIEATNEVGVPLVAFGLMLVLIPILYIGYLFVTLLINKKPRWWVLLATILAWLLVLVGTIFAGIDYAENSSSVSFSSNSEVERIMKKFDDENDLSRQIMEKLDEEPDAEQKAQIKELINDVNAKSIDK
jgi:MFS family permease